MLKSGTLDSRVCTAGRSICTRDHDRMRGGCKEVQRRDCRCCQCSTLSVISLNHILLLVVSAVMYTKQHCCSFLQTCFGLRLDTKHSHIQPALRSLPNSRQPVQFQRSGQIINLKTVFVHAFIFTSSITASLL